MVLAGIAVLLGLLIAFPLGVLIHRRRGLEAPVTWIAGILYTIPSLALFALLVPYTGLTTTTAEIGLVSYTLLILIRNTAAGLRGVSADVREAAAGMGLTPRQILTRVEIPLAIPTVIAGVRIAAVTTVGLVTVTALIGKGGFGHFILMGLDRFFPTPIVVGAVLSVAMAVATDFLLIAAERVVTPWSRRAGAVS